MKSSRHLAIVVALALIVGVVAGQTGHMQGPRGSEPLPAQSGTAGTGLESPRALSDEAGRQEESAEPDLTAGYNATVRIPVAALKPRESNVEWGVGGEGGCTYASSGDEFTWWAAPLYLPDGATLRYFRMYYNDQSEAISCAAYLTVYDLFGDIVTEWGIFSSGTGQNYATTAELDHVIDYNSYNYVINWSPNMIGPDMQVCGFRVFYEYTWGLAFLPNVMKGY